MRRYEKGAHMRLAGIGMCLIAGLLSATSALADNREAKQAFGHTDTPSAQHPEPIGFYSKGCQAGAVQIPATGPTWQAMRLSRNRRWGQPRLVDLIQRLSRDGAQHDGWPGLLVGDMSQPRGGPMLTGHASHQVGLDADIWLTPMPSRVLTAKERENLSAVSVLDKSKFLTLDRKVWTTSHARLIMRAASYPEVQRIFVNPAIKKELCNTWNGDPNVLGKVRPYYSHDYHFHIRLFCPPGSPDCKPQASVPAGDGCGKQLAWWFSDEPWAKPKPKPADKNKPKPKPKIVTVDDLPRSCSNVLAAPAAPADDNMGVVISAKASIAAEKGTPVTSLASAATISAVPLPAAPPVQASAYVALPDIVPLPVFRPNR